MTREELQAAIGADATTAERLLGAAASVVQRYAPAAPEPVQVEAIVRVAGWLFQSPASGFYEAQRGERQFRLVRSVNPSAMRSSGAAALLLPWREHNALSTAADDPGGPMPIELLNGRNTESSPFRVTVSRRVGLLFATVPLAAIFLTVEARLQSPADAPWVAVVDELDEGRITAAGLTFVQLDPGLDYRVVASEAGATVSIVDGLGVTVVT